jgi:hypothetical protein
MTPASSILDPNSDPAVYVAAVLTLYVDLPDTPLRASVPDQRQARLWFDRGFPWNWLRPLSCWPASVARCGPLTCHHCRESVPWPTSNPSLKNSKEHPVVGGYLQYLRLKLRGIVDSPTPAKVQKSTFSDDR